MNKMKKLKIEFRYYDKTACERCKITDETAIKTVKIIRKALKELGLEKVEFRETKIPKSKIHLSNSILINEKDIEKIINPHSKYKENLCESCCLLFNEPTNCRTYTYKGKRYNSIPKDMIKTAIRIMLKSE